MLIPRSGPRVTVSEDERTGEARSLVIELPKACVQPEAAIVLAVPVGAASGHASCRLCVILSVSEPCPLLCLVLDVGLSEMNLELIHHRQNSLQA